MNAQFVSIIVNYCYVYIGCSRIIGTGYYSMFMVPCILERLGNIFKNCFMSNKDFSIVIENLRAFLKRRQSNFSSFEELFALKFLNCSTWVIVLRKDSAL